MNERSESRDGADTGGRPQSTEVLPIPPRLIPSSSHDFNAEVPAQPPAVTPGPTSGWPANPPAARWSLVADNTPVLTNADGRAPVLSTLLAGEEVDFCRIVSHGQEKWCEIRLRDGKTGFVGGTTAIKQLPYVQLAQSWAEMRQEPAATASVLHRMSRGTGFLILRTVKGETGDWIRIRIADGSEGYLDGKAKVEKGKKPLHPERDMAIGGALCLVGIAVTAATYSAAADSGGHYIIAWGAILFGGARFLKGLFHATTSSDRR